MKLDTVGFNCFNRFNEFSESVSGFSSRRSNSPAKVECLGVGIVTKISLRGDEVMVDFGSGVEWLDRKNLEVVPAEAKAS